MYVSYNLKYRYIQHGTATKTRRADGFLGLRRHELMVYSSPCTESYYDHTPRCMFIFMGTLGPERVSRDALRKIHLT